MKKLTARIAVMTVLLLFTGMLMADTVKFRLVVSRNDATVGGELHVDLEMAITSGTSPRTLNSLTADVLFGSELSVPGSFATGVPFGSSDGYSLSVTNPSSGQYRFLVTGSDVNKDDLGFCANGSGTRNGFNITTSFQKIITFKWIINTATMVNISIDDATDAAAYFEKLGNNPCSDAIDWDVENEDLGDVAVPVELTLFAAEQKDSGILLTWRTETETENMGFHVYRSLNENGDYARINDEIIRGAGSSVENHDYFYIDNNIEAGNTYYYKLADVDFNGL
ncbi:MAG: hypothetical protein ACE5NG_21230, partial [bacterium]